MNTQELIEKLQSKFPLFTYKAEGNRVRVIMDVGETSIDENYEQYMGDTFEREHKRLEEKLKWQAKYPHLHFYINGSDYKPSSIWVERDGRDGEAIHYIIQDDPPYMQDIMLQHFDCEAKKALQPGWFFCTGCGEAKPRSEYGYFYFAGEYCKKCQEDDPEHYRMAMSESYN